MKTLVLLCLGLTTSLLAQSGPSTLSLVAVLRDESALAGAHDIEVRDGTAYIAGKGFSSRARPASGTYPYPKGKGGSLAIVDVRQPAAPRLLWHATDPLTYENAETVLPLGKGRLLVGTRDLFTFDISVPKHPKQLAAISDRSRVDMINGFARLGDVVFGANKQGYIVAVDVSFPDELRLFGTRETRASGELGLPHDAAMSGGMLVVVSPEGFGAQGQPGRLAIYRVADSRSQKPLPADQWALIGRLEHPRLAGANRVMTLGSYAYVGSSLTPGSSRTDGLRANLSVIDMTNPTMPRLRGSVDFPDVQGPNGLEIAGNLAFVAGGQTVMAIDVSNPEVPGERARFTSPEAFPGAQDDAHDLVFHDDHLFVTAQNSHSLVILRFAEGK